jgi:hypothetical protein
MAKYSTSVRNARMTALMTDIRGGTAILCDGTPPATLSVPGAGVRLSEHAVGGSAGTVSSGALTFGDADIGPDTSSNKSGTPTHIVFISSGGAAVAQWSIPSECSISINGGATTVITAGQETDIDQFSVAEGNA